MVERGNHNPNVDCCNQYFNISWEANKAAIKAIYFNF
uniref:Uncharacterized protein n=1 Tax=Globisporangium ultimum (strain ATCC 200006 / CBS 805.95 / DAOM BR144) TaxID=431595 RepID=K3XD77_GLOUD